MRRPHYLYVSFLKRGSCFGHIMRAFACVRQCIALGHVIDIALTSRGEAHEDLTETREYEALLHMHRDLIDHPSVRMVSRLTQHYDAIFLDLQHLDYTRFCFYQKHGFCIGIDLGGEARECVPYLIDTLPNALSSPNVYDPAGFVDAVATVNKTGQQGPSVYDRLFTCADKIKSWYGEKSPVNPFDSTNTRMPTALWRDEERSIFMCKKTRLMFQIPCADPVAYDDAYFFSDYKAQYGRTYLEDFDAMCKKADDRLDCIDGIVRKRQRSKGCVRALRLIDLGCAYGAMLTRAQERGFISCGVDINENACAYVKNTLGIPALCASVFHNSFDVMHAAFAKEYAAHFHIREGEDMRYDVVSCCYVLEHTPHFDTAIDIISRLLKPGGIFALAVSNGRGISARRCFTRFLRENPIDRFSIFSPKPLIEVLHTRGFALRALRITGNHPSRVFPSTLQWILHPSVQCVVRALSKFFHVGDTCELYVEKTS